MTDEKPVCPECSSPRIWRRTTRNKGHARDDCDWLCDECGATFDDPAERELQNGGPTAETILDRLREE